jgi:hypothetical protein
MPLNAKVLPAANGVPPQFPLALQFPLTALPPVQFANPGAITTGFTTSVTVSVLDKLPLVAVSVSGYVPGAALFDTTTFNVVEPAPVIVGGAKLALAFAGTPVTSNVTRSLKPFVATMVAV